MWARQYSTDPAVLGQKIGQHRLYGDDLVTRELEMTIAKGRAAGDPDLTKMQVPSTVTERTQMLCKAREILKRRSNAPAPDPPTAREGCSAERGRELAADALKHPFLAHSDRR